MVGKLPLDYLMNIIVENEKSFQKEIITNTLSELNLTDLYEIKEVLDDCIETLALRTEDIREDEIA